MSRIIVRNLPEKITKEKLTEIFSEKGIVTDVQLKFTKSGKFRKFAFIGFKDENHADIAVKHLNKTYINTSEIQVEECVSLADTNKPRAWSKYNPESSAYKSKKKASSIIDEPLTDPEVPTKKKKKDKKINDPKIEELLNKHKDDVMFKEFLETHKIDSKELIEEDEINISDDTKIADRSISDAEYLKSKFSKNLEEETKIEKKEKVKIENKVNNLKLFTIKLIGLPYHVKKSAIKKFLDGVKPYSIRIPTKIKGIAFCGFKTEQERKKALVKNRSFLNGKRILVVQYENKEDVVEVNEKWKSQEERLKNQEGIAESGRIFVRNLSYTVTEEDVTKLFEKFGPISEVILPIDEFSRKPKGFGIVTFLIPEHACKAFTELDGTILQGRMLHLLPGLPSKEIKEDEIDGTFKQKKQMKQKLSANNKVNWNTFFIGENQLAGAIASIYDTSKEKVLNDNRAAVNLALGETQIVNDTKQFLEEHGVCLDVFSNMMTCPRSKTIILVKNLPQGTKMEEIRDKFVPFGELKKFLMPPTCAAALVEFIEPSEARKAFKKLAYSKFKHLPLYLEWAPEKTFSSKENVKTDVAQENNNVERDTSDYKTKVVEKEEKIEETKDAIIEEEDEPMEPVEGSVIFVKNLNFSTDEAKLRKHFSSCGRIVSVTVALKKDPLRPGARLSMGYGFVTFNTKNSADTALKTLQNSTLDDHQIELKRSNRTTASKPEGVRKTTAIGKASTKILVRNIPFQATEKEIRQLFKTFGEIRALRLPKKMVGTGTHRGFCFVEYHTVKEAKLAFNALAQSTHLYGRRLVLEWAAVDDDSVETIREKTKQSFRYFAMSDSSKKKITIDEPAPDDE